MGKLFGDEDETNVSLQDNPSGDRSSGDEEKQVNVFHEGSPEILGGPNGVEKGSGPVHIER